MRVIWNIFELVIGLLAMAITIYGIATLGLNGWWTEVIRQGTDVMSMIPSK